MQLLQMSQHIPEKKIREDELHILYVCAQGNGMIVYMRL